jgi:RNA polymerase sigma-70 factor (ECF subfamily)
MSLPEGGLLKKNVADDPIRAALARDDPAAVELIWDRYAGDVLVFLEAILGSRHDAEDVLQTVFVKIVYKRRWLAQARRLDAYIYRIARNEAATHLRRKRRQKRPETEADLWLEGMAPDRQGDELAEQVQVALAQLAPAQREVVVLKMYREKTFQEIGRLLGVSLNTAASRYRYGMERLRALLKDRLS